MTGCPSVTFVPRYRHDRLRGTRNALPSKMSSVRWELRSVTDDDREFLFDLMKDSYFAHVVATWGAWDEEDQRRRFEGRFESGDQRIILVDGERVGLLAVELPTELFLANIESPRVGVAEGWARPFCGG
jgi:hypothetical protein